MEGQPVNCKFEADQLINARPGKARRGEARRARDRSVLRAPRSSNLQPKLYELRADRIWRTGPLQFNPLSSFSTNRALVIISPAVLNSRARPPCRPTIEKVVAGQRMAPISCPRAQYSLLSTTQCLSRKWKSATARNHSTTEQISSVRYQLAACLAQLSYFQSASATS